MKIWKKRFHGSGDTSPIGVVRARLQYSLTSNHYPNTASAEGYYHPSTDAFTTVNYTSYGTSVIIMVGSGLNSTSAQQIGIQCYDYEASAIVQMISVTNKAYLSTTTPWYVLTNDPETDFSGYFTALGVQKRLKVKIQGHQNDTGLDMTLSIEN